MVELTGFEGLMELGQYWTEEANYWYQKAHDYHQYGDAGMHNTAVARAQVYQEAARKLAAEIAEIKRRSVEPMYRMDL